MSEAGSESLHDALSTTLEAAYAETNTQRRRVHRGKRFGLALILTGTLAAVGAVVDVLPDSVGELGGGVAMGLAFNAPRLRRNQLAINRLAKSTAVAQVALANSAGANSPQWALKELSQQNIDSVEVSSEDPLLSLHSALGTLEGSGEPPQVRPPRSN